MSIACWVVVFSPQIYENYFLQSGEGLSLIFVVTWLVGDLFNLVGAVWGGLLPTMIILALYYVICDSILLMQIYYYRRKRRRLLSDERQPLLPSNNPETISAALLLVRYTGALLFVVAVGVVAWWIGEIQQIDPTPPPSSRLEIHILGWTSAVLYLVARIPQIFKNPKTRCEGLSPALFFFSMFGNVTYSLSICSESMDREYLLTNASWLAGSALTVFLDAIVLCQIFYYRL